MRDRWLVEARAACEGAAALQAAVVFGSALRVDDPGDLDLALLWDPGLPDDLRWRRADDIAAELEHRLVSDELAVDVQDLRRLPLALQFRVLREGRPVLVVDRRRGSASSP